MCRIFAYSGDMSSPIYFEALEKFALLGENGCVPCGIESGHLDGWGIHTSDHKDNAYFRSVNSVSKDKVIDIANQLKDSYGQTVVHLRKATVGKNVICNTHPFMRTGISFCHNGSIHALPETAFTNVRNLREGHTDSETFFIKILDRVEGQVGDISLEVLKNALIDEVTEIKNTTKWTSLTCLLKSNDGIILNYLWNEKHPDSEKLGFKDYYTFFVGKKGDITIMCSETLDIQGFVWEKLVNDTVFVLNSPKLIKND